MRRTTKLVLTVPMTAAAVGAVLLPAPSVQAADPTCSAGAVELVGASAGRLTSGSDHVQGYLLRRTGESGSQCVVPGATVELLARDAGQQVTRVVRTAVTDDAGRVQFRVRPPLTVVLSARSVATEQHPSAQSSTAVVEVGTRLGFAIRTVDDCRVAVAGRTYPAKPGTAVEVFRVTERSGLVRIGAPRVAADGSYSATLAVPCGNRDRLLATIQRTARNGAGYSGLPVPPATSVVTCGTGAVQDARTAGLTQRFVPFNLVTAVGGAWWGERVVSNTSAETITFDRFSSQSFDLLRLGTQQRIGMNPLHDAIEVRATTLKPGESLREPVMLGARNCLEDTAGRPAFTVGQGPPFKAGTVVVGRTLLSTDLGTSVSQRVELRVQ